jgi:tellurite resistance protein TehA-like permease
MTTAWLLPIVTLIVCSSSAGVLANALKEYSISNALITVIVDIFIVTVGFTLSFIIFTIYFERLFVHGLPKGPSALTVFLPLGPTGQAGFAVVLIGQNLNNLLPAERSSSTFLSWPYTGEVLYVLCICIAFLLWTLATMFLFFALMTVASTLRKTHIAFTPNFWGLVFPNVR